MTDGKETTSPASGSGTTPVSCTTEPCPVPVTVVINLLQAVACPGHPLSMTAVGTPGGGTYKWTISGGTAQLVDAGGTPTTTGPTVYLRAFKADDATGNIPAQAATVGVTYTHPNGTATDSKNVPIHKIEFVVTNATVTSGLTQRRELPGGVRISHAGTATVSITPRVEIQLDASCPRKAACAANHRVGWLQVVLTNDRRSRFTHTLVEVTVVLPIRDEIGTSTTPAPQFPFYANVATFTGDRDKQTAHHEDSPGMGAAWVDPRPAAPNPPPAINRQLRSISFSNGFTAWTVVQNIEWSVHHLNDSFAYLRHFDWSMQLNLTVDTTQPVGSRCTPANNAPTVGAVGIGKGGGTPVLTTPFPNVNHTVNTNPAPVI